MHKSTNNSPEKRRSLGVGEDDAGSFLSNSPPYSHSSSEDSAMANWEPYVLEDGSLFYIEHGAHEAPTEKNEASGGVEFPKTAPKSTKKNSRRPPTSKEDVSQLMFSSVNTSEEACKTLELVITATDRYRFGRRSTAVESILGFRVAPFVDQPECLMVDGFVHDMPALFQQEHQAPIMRGDWFKSLDHIEIRASNIDDLLLQFIEPTKVCLKFQGPVRQPSEEKTKAFAGFDEIKKIENYDQFVETFKGIIKPPSSESMDFGLLILPPECYQNDDHKTSLFYYPEDPNNFLYKARGSFLTLNSILSDELKTPPTVSELRSGDVDYLVFYRKIENFLVLFTYPASLMTMSEGELRSDELLTYISFMQPNMCLDSFKCPRFRQFMQNFCVIQRYQLLLQKTQKRTHFPFEESLKETRHLPLPKEAQLRIFDALSEMEAMDYRNWNNEPLHTHREFFIYGSALYYDNLLLASQMPVGHRHLIDVYMRCRGLFDFVTRHDIKELCIWKEIRLPGNANRFFLAICGRGHLTLAVVMKLFIFPDMEPDEQIDPSLFYIEEIQETLDHLIQCGIQSLAMFWHVSNKRPETVDFTLTKSESADATKESKKSESGGKPKSGASTSKEAVHQLQRSTSCDEDAPVGSSLGGSSVHSLTPSEEEGSKKRLVSTLDDSDSGSDWENFTEDNFSRLGNGPKKQSFIQDSLWKEINNVVPMKISPGWNNDIFYYVYVDGQSKTCFSPMKITPEALPFAREIHLAFHRIREVLQKAKNVKRDSANNGPSRDLLPVKEYGMTIELREGDIKKFEFVAAGRLFHSPPKEVYICHRPNISANMVEMAFRLSFFGAG